MKKHVTTAFLLLALSYCGIGFSCSDGISQGADAAETNPRMESQTIGLNQDYEMYAPSGENVVYIDPENGADTEQDGTEAHPYDSFGDFRFEDEHVYAIKRGTELTCDGIIITADHVTICSYGEGERPVINSLADVNDSSKQDHAILSHYQGVENPVIRDLEIYAPKAMSCIRFLYYNTDAQVINCKLHGSIHAIRSFSTTGLTIYNTEIYKTWDDGMYIKWTSDIEISYCYIHEVNQNWESEDSTEEDAGGDGIQFEECNAWHVHNNLIDRSDTGNKFCFISNNPNQDDGVFEYNHCIGPLFNGHSIYLHDGTGLIIRYNRIEKPSGAPVYTHSDKLQFYGNIVIESGSPFFESNSADVYHNLFYNVDQIFTGYGTISATNNIYYRDSGDIVLGSGTFSGSNNLYSSGNPSDGSFTGTVLFEDAAEGDFHLTADSDGIDAGIAIAGYTQDMDGNTVPAGSAPDIGPYEYQ